MHDEIYRRNVRTCLTWLPNVLTINFRRDDSQTQHRSHTRLCCQDGVQNLDSILLARFNIWNQTQNNFDEFLQFRYRLC